jgi:HEAT repeat protein
LATTPLALKLAIVRALGWIEQGIALNYLRDAIQKSDRSVCLEIIQILGAQSLPQLKYLATEILIEFFNSRPQICLLPEIRQGLATALGELRQQSAGVLLQKLAEDRDRRVVLHARAAFRKIAAI